MSTRLPLAPSGVENVHVNKPSGKEDATTTKPGGKAHGNESNMEREIQSLKARVSRRDEAIATLQKQVKSHASRQELETQVGEIVKRHEASKAKYHSDISKLKATNEALVKSNEESKAKEGKVLVKVSDIRSKLALAEAENIRLKKELASRPVPQAGPSVDDRLTWRKERATMEVEIRALRKEVETRSTQEEEAVKEMAMLKGVRGENERLKYGWAVMTDRYEDLYDTFESVKKEWGMERKSLESEVVQLRSTTRHLESVLGEKEEECKDHLYRLDDMSSERDCLSEIVDGLRATIMEGTTQDRHAPFTNEVAPLSPMVELSDVTTLLDLAIGHSELLREQASELDSHIFGLTASILHLEQSLRETTSALTTLQAAHSRMETEYGETRLEHASCAVTISQLRYDADQANQITAVREEELGEVRTELHKADEKRAKQAELLARAEENEARSKFAQESLEEEIVHLQQKYHEFAGYEEKYEELLERQALLEAREGVAIEEAERLAMQNAELLGHTNGGQRIGYVDNVRREMVLCKHELASTRHLLNNANDRIRALESEISAYRTISPDLGLGQSRTRVVRRQPEGSHLTASTSAGTRQASGSGAGVRRFA